jgi:hypothetical protein
MLRSCHDSFLLAPSCLSDHLLGGASEGASTAQLPAAADDAASHGGDGRESEAGDRSSAMRRDGGAVQSGMARAWSPCNFLV